eukprot:365691-Chlamydomonas_euryale.AAC.9
MQGTAQEKGGAIGRKEARSSGKVEERKATPGRGRPAARPRFGRSRGRCPTCCTVRRCADDQAPAWWTWFATLLRARCEV